MEPQGGEGAPSWGWGSATAVTEGSLTADLRSTVSASSPWRRSQRRTRRTRESPCGARTRIGLCDVCAFAQTPRAEINVNVRGRTAHAHVHGLPSCAAARAGTKSPSTLGLGSPYDPALKQTCAPRAQAEQGQADLARLVSGRAQKRRTRQRGTEAKWGQYEH